MTADPSKTARASSHLLELENVAAHYGDLQALFGVTLRVKSGEIVALIGANGAGKTTLLRVISGMKPLSSGSLRFDGADVSRGVPAHEMVARGVSHVPEGRQMFPFLTVRENLSLGAYTPRARGRWKESLQEQLTLFPRLGERLGQLAGTLSGGEQQMVAIARGLMARPKLLLLDEPSLGLAPKMTEQVFGMIGELRSEGLTIMLIEQKARQTLKFADRAYLLETGRMVTSGMASELARDSIVSEAFLGASASEVGRAKA